MRPSATCLILSALVAISTIGAEKKQPWSLKPVAAVQPPSSARNPIDAFLMQAREKKGVRSVAQADRATLLRRVSLDLIGLPPTPEEIRHFVEDRSPDAYEKAVDRLLASRHHGERYARHWLDVLRYADVDENMPAESGIFLYRDWVISALNRDLSYKEFVRGQLLFTSEFGRSPWSQNTKGRDHNPRGFTSWLAGGGVKGGIVHGSTDEVGYHAVENRHYISDLQATILRQMGIDHHKMVAVVNSRPIRLVEEGFGPISEILS